MNRSLDIDPNVWHDLNPLLDEALDLPASKRAEWLDNLAPLYEAIKPQLRNLLCGSRSQGPLLGTLPKLDAMSTGEGDAEGRSSERPGDAVGPYRLVRHLAQGGMGSVWLAERCDGMIHRPVALKLPHGTWQREALAERLAREREILAALNHPNIARLYDAGFTPDGRPYLVLEYVEGRHIDKHCEARTLDLKTRLRLFLQVTRAVASAHARLVVHRDLKPSNILVTEGGQVKLLDFGIAKLLEKAKPWEARLTNVSGCPLTPDYASPEQIAGEPIGTASDVYSLGVVLYRLITGTQPYKLKRDSRAALEEAILQAEPALPSEVAAEPSLRRLLRGDIDTIVLHALKKRPEQRYSTVNAFEEDIERYLEGKPVQARPDARWYRLSKFVSRNKLAACAAAAVLVATLAGAGAAVWQMNVALTEKRKAEEVKEFLVSTLQDTDPYAGSGKVLSALDMLKQARNKIDRTFGGRPELRVELLNVLAWSLLSLQDTAAAETVVTEAVEEAVSKLGADHPQTLRARVLLTIVHRFRGRTREMRAELDRLLPTLRRNADRSSLDLVRALRNNANLAMHEGRYDAARSAANEALDLAISKYGERHPETATSLVVVALAHIYGGRPELALETAGRAYRLTLDLHDGNARHPRAIEARDLYGRALAEIAQPDRAMEQLTQALTDAAQVFGPSALTVGFYSQHLALCQLDVGEISQALENTARACAIVARHANSNSYIYAAQVHARGISLLEARKGKEALADLSRALETFQRTLGTSHNITRSAQISRALALGYTGKVNEARQELEPLIKHDQKSKEGSVSRSLHVLGLVRRLAGDHVEALRLQDASLNSIQEGPKAGLERMRVLTEAGLNQVALGNYVAAISSFERALTLFRTLQKRVTPAHADALAGLGRARMGQGNSAAALPLLQKANEFWRDFDAGNRSAGEAALWLSRCYDSLGRTADARQWRSRARKILSPSRVVGDFQLARLDSRD